MFVLDPARERMCAEEVRGTRMADVVFARVAAVQSLECLRDPAVGRVEQQMVMVRHQDVRDDAESEQRDRLGEVGEEEVAVAVVDEQAAVVAAVAGYVVDALRVQAERSTHLGHGKAAGRALRR